MSDDVRHVVHVTAVLSSWDYDEFITWPESCDLCYEERAMVCQHIAQHYWDNHDGWEWMEDDVKVLIGPPEGCIGPPELYKVYIETAIHFSWGYRPCPKL